MKEDIGFVYKWRNVNNGKYYIGSHKGDVNDGYIGSGLLFTRAVKKYKISSFKREILYTGKKYKEEEEKILKKIDAANDNKSYNMKNEALGGSFKREKNGMWHKKQTDETKNKIASASKKMWDKKHRDAQSKKMVGKNNPMYGIKKSKFTINKMKQTLRTKKENWGFLGHENIHSASFRKILRELILKGKYSSPRGLKILELENFTYRVPKYVRFMNFKSRKLSIKYIKKEFLWYLKGDKYDTSITKYASLWKELINEDGSINSNYGQYIFSNGMFEKTFNELKKDKSSRRASIMILNNNHFDGKTKDLPCTYDINFRIRDDKLTMTVRMRSQDGIFGMGNDLPVFSFIHEMMYIKLKDIYTDLEYGDYIHSADSFHIYEKHFDILKKITGYNMPDETKKRSKHDRLSLVLCPKISCSTEVDYLIKNNYKKIPDEYKFTKWLLT